MARLENYELDTNVSGQDKVLGTDSSGSTKNYSLDSIGEYFSKNDIVKSNTQFSMKFVSSVDDLGYATIARSSFGGNNTSMTGLTSFLISRYNSKGESIEKLVRRVVSEKIIMSSYSDQDTHCVYSINDVSISVNYPNFLQVSVDSLNGNGVFTDNEYFIISVSSGTGDKTYVYSQEVNSTTWEINHGLNKNPSVTIVNSSDIQVVAEVEYVDTNNLTVKFVNSTSGKAYLN